MATFQRLVDKLLKPHAAYAAAYIYDVIIYSQTWEEHLTQLEAVLREIGQAGLTVNPEKCKIGMKSVSFGGL